MTETTKSIQAFALAIAQMSRQALDRTTQHIEKLRKAHSMEEVTSIQLDFVKDSLEHATQHTRKVSDMLATGPAEMAKTYQNDWLQLGHAAAASVERFTVVARKD